MSRKIRYDPFFDYVVDWEDNLSTNSDSPVQIINVETETHINNVDSPSYETNQLINRLADHLILMSATIKSFYDNSEKTACIPLLDEIESTLRSIQKRLKEFQSEQAR